MAQRRAKFLNLNITIFDLIDRIHRYDDVDPNERDEIKFFGRKSNHYTYLGGFWGKEMTHIDDDTGHTILSLYITHFSKCSLAIIKFMI